VRGLGPFAWLKTRRGRIGACLMFKDEARYLDEWIRYHYAIGVDVFFLYNNFSSDHFRRVLLPYRLRGIVRLVNWPVPAGQRRAYMHCLVHFGPLVDWMAFIDIDEFIVIETGEILPQVLEDFGDHGGLAIHWLNFGPSGHDRRPKGRVTDLYRDRLPDEHPINKRIKCIVRPRRVQGLRNVHNFYSDLPIVNVDGEQMNFYPPAKPYADKTLHRRIYLNHYYTRSIEDFREKIAKAEDRRRGIGISRPVENLDRYLAHATIRDDRIEAITTRIDWRRLQRLAPADKAEAASNPAPRRADPR
jgi:hypothetical protein